MADTAVERFLRGYLPAIVRREAPEKTDALVSQDAKRAVTPGRLAPVHRHPNPGAIRHAIGRLRCHVERKRQPDGCIRAARRSRVTVVPFRGVQATRSNSGRSGRH
jgi:hypothetical protein